VHERCRTCKEITFYTYEYLANNMAIPPIPQLLYEKIDFIVGLLVGGAGTFVAWYNRKKELRATLYYPLWLACYNLLLLFDEIDIYGGDEPRGKELFNSAIQPLNDIMQSYGTAVHLKGKHKKSGEDYLSIFFRVKRIIDLNHKAVTSNWSQAVIWLKNAKERTYSGDDALLLDKIGEFEGLYKDLKNLKEFCEGKDNSLKGERI